MKTLTAGVTFEAFFRSNPASLAALGTFLTGDRNHGEDLAQEAMKAASESWNEVREYEQPLAFARRVVVNRASNERRRRGRERLALVRLGAGRRPAAATSTFETRQPLWAAVAELPPQQRAAVALRYLDDLPAADIAEALQCSESTVRVHLHRAHATLAERLVAEWSDQGDGSIDTGREVPR